MPNDNLKKYYSYLKSNGADVAPTYEAFANALSDENNAKKYHSYLLKNKFDAPQSYDVFSQKLGIVKKKETTVLPSVQKIQPISSGTQPKETQKPLATSVSKKKQIEVFTNFPTKEDNEYRIVNNNWQRKEPGKDWTTVRDSNAIIGLNKQYKKNIVPNEGFEGISSKLIDNSEETVVPYLQRNYGNLGFKFEQTGAGDRVRVLTEDGKNSEVFTLDNWTDEGDSSEAVRLKAWLKENTNTIQRERYNKIDSEISSIKNAKPKEKADLTKDAFANMSAGIPEDLSLDIKSQLKLKEKEKEAMQYNKSRMNALMDDISKAKKTEGKLDDAEARARVAAVYGNKDEIAKQNRYINNSLNDIARVSTATDQRAKEYDQEVVRWQADLEQNNGVETPELAERKRALEGRAEMINKEITDLDENLKLSKSYQSKLDDIAGEYMLFKESKGSTGGAMVNNFIKGATNILRFAGLERTSQEELIKAIGSDYTTEEFATSKDRSDIEKVLFSLSNSIGAAVGGGGVATPVSFFAQSYYDVKDEMDDNPDFNSVPELEKTLVAGTIGVAVGFLEKFGLDRLMSKTPIGKNIVNRILLRSVKDLPKKATAEMLEESINSNMKRLLAKGALNVVGGMIVEGSTEFSQELVEGGVKELYNEMKGKEMFQSPDSLLAQSFEAAYLGAMGGAVMQAPVQSANVIATGLSNKNKLLAEVLEKSVTDSELRSMMTSKIKTQILNGEITKEEGQKQLDAVNEAAVTFDKLPDNITEESRTKSFDLLIEKSKIEKEIAGKDENLVSAQKARITNINNELKTISENAVKESTKPVEEVTAEGGGIQRERVDEGQLEVGQREGAVGQTAQQEADLGNRPVEGRGAEEARVTRNVINRPATLSEFGGKTFDTPLQGDTYVDGQQVVFEDRATGRIYELGNIDEVMDSSVPGLQAQEETVSITPEGKVSIEGNNWNIQSELPTQGIEYNPAGEVTRVSLKDDAGNTQMFEGQQAVDIAYQIELQKIQSTEQQQFINDLLEQDEEFQTATESIKPRQIETVVKEEAAPDIVPTESTVTEETIVEQPIAEQFSAEEVERLGKLLEGTDEEIENQIGTLTISKDNSKVAKSIANAAKSITKILPDVKFVVHDNDESYRKATGEQGRSQSSAGEYNPKTKTININASKANNRTAAHEVFHAILLNKIGSDIEAQRLTKAMINSVMKSLVQVKGSPKIISYLNDFASNYEKNIQNEEKLAELFGILADGYNSLPYSTKNIIKRFLDRMAKLFGLKPFTDREVIEFMNNVSYSVEAGYEIAQKDISFLGNGTIDVTTPRKSKFIDSLVFERFPTNKNTKVIEDFKLSDINGQVAASTLSDKLTAGKLKKVKTVKGQEIVDAEYIFYGGVGYPEVTGYVWAASTKDGVQKIIDSMVVSSDGYRYLIPAIMSNTSHMSNRNMTLITMEVFKEAIANNELNRTKFKELVSKAFNNKKAEKFKDGALNAISGNISGNQMCDNLKNYMLSSKMSFESRKDVLKSMVGNPESGNPKFSTVGTYLSLATSLSEPMVKDADMHQVAVVIRTKGNLTPKETDTNDVFYHDSYGFHIESDQEIEVLHLDGIYNLVDVIPEFTTDQGRTVSTEEELKEKGQKGWDIKRILTNLGRTHGLSKYSAEIVSPRKQLVAPNGKPSNLNEKQWNQVRTTEFKKWFGDWENDPNNASKVVDENGEPLVVYHGTRKSFDEFSYDVNLANFREGALEYSFWFTSNKKNSELYGDQVMEVFLNSRNPIEIDYTNPESYREVVVPADKTRAMSIAEFNEKKGNIKHSQMKKGIELRMSENKTIDGIIHKNIKDIILSDNFQVFNPTQVKSATENVGTFSELDKSIRKQKADTISKMVSIAKDNNFSDSAIREYLKRKGFSDKESTNAINEYNIKKEDIFVAKDGGVPTKISDSIQSFKKKFFSARAFLPKSVFGYKENKEADIARNLNIVDLNVKDFNRLYKKYKGDKEQLLLDFDAYIRGDKDAKLPKEFLSVADSMRNQIDNLSRQLIDNGLVDADMAQTIKDNLGQYLTRSYKIYDRENWKKEVQEEVKQKARNFLRSQYKSMAEELAAKEDIPVDEVLDNIVDNKMDEMLTTEGASNFITGSKLGAKDLSVLKERQDIPFEIRALMGEYSDPALNYAKTVLKLSSLAANHKFLTEVKNAGMGVYLFEKNDPRRPKDFNTMIAAEGSKGMNPLNGLYTTKEIASQFEAQSNQLSEFMKLFMKFQSSIRWAKTIGSVATHMKNVIGNLGFVWTNGHFEPAALAKAYTTVRNDFSKINKQDLRDRMNNYISLGIVKQSAGLGEIKDMFKDANWDTAMASRLSNERLGILGKAKRFFLQKKKGLEDAYQAEDDFFKIIAYENELSRYSEAMFNKNKNNLTEEELKEVNKVVTEIVKNTYPTYDRIPEAIKMIRRAPFIGNFVSFQAEAYRTAWNTMILAKNELASDNPKIKSIGAKRLLGATSYISAKTAALQYFSMAAGAGLTGVIGYLFDDDDEEKRDKDIREFVAPWSKESDLIVLEVGNGKLQYIDFSASDPHGSIKKVINSFLQGDSTLDSFIDGAMATVSPFIGEEMTTEALLELKNNQDKYGKQIWNPEDDLSEQSKNILSHVYKLVEPGTFSSIRRGISAENKGRELVANITGFRVYDVDVNEQFGFKMRDYSERIKNAKKIYNSSFYDEEATADEKEKAYKNANKAVKGIYEDIIKIYNSAERLGVKPESLYSTMSDFGGIAKYKIEEIQSGKIEDLKRKEEE